MDSTALRHHDRARRRSIRALARSHPALRTAEAPQPRNWPRFAWHPSWWPLERPGAADGPAAPGCRCATRTNPRLPA